MKKLLAALLAVMMLALPLSGLAATPNDLINDALSNGRSVTIESGTAVSEDVRTLAAYFDQTGTATGLLDLVEAAGLKVTGQQGQVAFTMEMNGEEFTDVIAMQDGAFYRQGILMDKPVVVDTDEVAAIIRRAADYLQKNGTDENVVALINGCADALEQDGYAGLLSYIAGYAMQIIADQTGMSVEELQAMLGNAQVSLSSIAQDLPGFISQYITFDNTLAAITAIIGKAETSDATGMEMPGDAAVTCGTITLTNEDVADVLNALLKDLGDSKLAESINAKLADYGITVADLLSFVGAAAVEKITATDVTYTIAVYMDETGNVVYMQETVVAKANGQTMSVVIGEWSTTVDNGKKTDVIFSIGLDETEIVGISAEVLQYDDGVTEGSTLAGTMQLYDTEVLRVDGAKERQYSDLPSMKATLAFTLIMNGSEYVLGTTNELVTEMNGEDFVMTATMTPYVDVADTMIELGSHTVVISSGEPMESIVTEDALRLSTMTDEEIQTWRNTEGSTAMREKFVNAIPETARTAIQTLIGGTQAQTVE